MFRVAVCLFVLLRALSSVWADEKSVIFEAHAGGQSIDSASGTRMVDALVMEVTGRHEIGAAWSTLVRPTDRVGIKISASGGRDFSTHRAVVDAIANGLTKAGVDRKNILVWDRGNLLEAGYGGANYAVRAIEPAYGYDPKQIFNAPMIGKLIWGDLGFVGKDDVKSRAASEQISNESHLARLLGTVTRIINVPVMSAHEGCGIAGALYNLTVPNVDNWRRFTVPGGADYLADLYADERIKPKVVLQIMDGLVAQYAGGPHYEPNYAFAHGALYASKDPVALDANALREIDAWRAQAKLPPLAPRADYLRNAAALGLGNAEASAIEIKSVR